MTLDQLMEVIEWAMAERGEAMSQSAAHDLRDLIAYALYIEDTGRSDLSNWMAPAAVERNADE